MDLANKNILVIDDFANMRMTVRTMLEMLGARQIDQAASGEQALRQLRANKYDIVLSDYNLGEGLDGQQVLDQARREKRVDVATVFIMITAEDSNAMVMGAVESAPDAYLSKPFTKDLLGARLERALRRRAPFEPVARALASGGPEAALQVLAGLAAQPGPGRMDALRIQAELALEAGNLDLVESACGEALAQGTLAWALTLLGRVAEARELPATAETRYREAIAATRHFMEARDRLATLLIALGRSDEALELLVESVALSSKSLARQRQLGQLARSLGRPDLAERAWRTAVILGKQMGGSRAADEAGMVTAMADRGQARQARKLAQNIAREYRQDPEAPWWELAARLHCLTVSDLSAERARVLELLDSQCLNGPPPPALADRLATALETLGETGRAAALRQGMAS